MWTYRQQTGHLLLDENLVGKGYSGAGKGKNNPALQNVKNVGPIPQGWYTIEGPPYNTAKHGDYVLRLKPAAENEMYGRDGFLIHGDSIKRPGTASTGCIILNPRLRKMIWDSGDHELTVVYGNLPARPVPGIPEPAPLIS